MVLPCVRMRTPVLRRQHKAGARFSYFMNGRKIQLSLGKATFRMALGAAEHCLCERAVLMKILSFGIQSQSSPQSTTLPGLSGPTSSGLFFLSSPSLLSHMAAVCQAKLVQNQDPGVHHCIPACSVHITFQRRLVGVFRISRILTTGSDQLLHSSDNTVELSCGPDFFQAQGSTASFKNKSLPEEHFLSQFASLLYFRACSRERGPA